MTLPANVLRLFSVNVKAPYIHYTRDFSYLENNK